MCPVTLCSAQVTNLSASKGCHAFPAPYYDIKWFHVCYCLSFISSGCFSMKSSLYFVLCFQPGFSLSCPHPWPSNMTGSLVCPSISGALCLKFIITNTSPWHAFKFYKGYPVKSFAQTPTLNVYQPWHSGVMVHVGFTFIFFGFFFLPLNHITVFFVLEES